MRLFRDLLAGELLCQLKTSVKSYLDPVEIQSIFCQLYLKVNRSIILKQMCMSSCV